MGKKYLTNVSGLEKLSYFSFNSKLNNIVIFLKIRYQHQRCLLKNLEKNLLVDLV